MTREVDLYPALHPERADLIDGAIGAMSSFDETFGYHADGVGPETAAMPSDWIRRASLHDIGEVTAICPAIHDRAASTAVAGRDKDADFVRTLLKERMIDIDTLLGRIVSLDAALHPVDSRVGRARRRAEEAVA